jgi:hypothetical protein
MPHRSKRPTPADLASDKLKKMTVEEMDEYYRKHHRQTTAQTQKK